MLSNADRAIDSLLRDALATGDIRLVSCRWLLADHADDRSLLIDKVSSLPTMARRQDLPPEAFLTPEQAVALMDRRNRSVLALSYGWLTAAHPDPHGTTLAAVRNYVHHAVLESNESVATTALGLFWDFASLPQRPRSATEDGQFKRGLVAMSSCYASITCTAVLQLRDVRLPASHDTQLPYNRTPYASRGWTTFEDGVSMFVVSHLSAAFKVRKHVPDDFVRAEQRRCKVTDISDGKIEARRAELVPERQLDATLERLSRAAFTGKGDAEMVRKMLMDFDALIKAGVASGQKGGPVTMTRLTSSTTAQLESSVSL